jgi:asparagine synthase (glutamine-hydrolysing)
MPGIAGVIALDRSADFAETAELMLDVMMHEPSYISGNCSAPELGVWAGWVAHSDSFAARESQIASGQAVTLAVSGECYHDGSPGPQGVIGGWYRRSPDHWVTELNGLFSGLLIDRNRRRACLFNDRYGVERIYVHTTPSVIYFASEAKALLRVVPEVRAFDDEGVAQFLTFGCPLQGRTLFNGVRRLEGGSLWVFEQWACSKTRYFVPAEWERQPALSAEAFQDEFQQTFAAALPRYVAGGTRLGISLTGGLDTRMIMACLPPLPRPPICYTFAGLRGDTLDARLARRVAAECGFDHRILRIGRDFLSEYGSHVDKSVYITDGCAGATGAHEAYLNAQARELAPIRLTGNFGSEVLRGMSTFKPLGLSPQLVIPDLRTVDVAQVAAEQGGQSPVTFAAFREIPSNLFGTMAAAKSQVIFRTPYLDNDLVALCYRAPSSVRESASSAMRLVNNARADLAHIPTDRAVTINTRGPGYLLKRLAAECSFKLDYIYSEALPRALMPLDAAIGRLATFGLIGQHKYLPYRVWFRNELATYIRDVLTDDATLRMGYWNRTFLATLADAHVKGHQNFVREIHAVITLAAVDRLLVRAGTFTSRRTVRAHRHAGAELLRK